MECTTLPPRLNLSGVYISDPVLKQKGIIFLVFLVCTYHTVIFWKESSRSRSLNRLGMERLCLEKCLRATGLILGRIWGLVDPQSRPHFENGVRQFNPATLRILVSRKLKTWFAGIRSLVQAIAETKCSTCTGENPISGQVRKDESSITLFIFKRKKRIPVSWQGHISRDVGFAFPSYVPSPVHNFKREKEATS